MTDGINYKENEALTMIKKIKKGNLAHLPSLIMAIYSHVPFLQNLSLCWMDGSKRHTRTIIRLKALE